MCLVPYVMRVKDFEANLDGTFFPPLLSLTYGTLAGLLRKRPHTQSGLWELLYCTADLSWFSPLTIHQL